MLTKELQCFAFALVPLLAVSPSAKAEVGLVQMLQVAQSLMAIIESGSGAWSNIGLNGGRDLGQVLANTEQILENQDVILRELANFENLLEASLQENDIQSDVLTLKSVARSVQQIVETGQVEQQSEALKLYRVHVDIIVGRLAERGGISSIAAFPIALVIQRLLHEITGTDESLIEAMSSANAETIEAWIDPSSPGQLGFVLEQLSQEHESMLLQLSQPRSIPFLTSVIYDNASQVIYAFDTSIFYSGDLALTDRSTSRIQCDMERCWRFDQASFSLYFEVSLVGQYSAQYPSWPNSVPEEFRFSGFSNYSGFLYGLNQNDYDHFACGIPRSRQTWSVNFRPIMSSL